MNAPKRIVVATDFSAPVEEALHVAAAMARRYGPRLGFAHVVPGVGPIHPLFPADARMEMLGMAAIDARAADALRDHARGILGATAVV